MALTAKLKLLRVLSVVQCCIAVWLVVLGIVERVRVRWQHAGLAMPIWVGIWAIAYTFCYKSITNTKKPYLFAAIEHQHWVGITGAFGTFITFKRVHYMSQGPVILQHLAMTLMGFSLTCGILSGLFIYNSSMELSTASNKEVSYFTHHHNDDFVVEFLPVTFDAKHSEEHALVSSIFGFMVVELIVAMWSAAICRVSDNNKSPSEDESCETPLILSPSSQEQGGKSAASRFVYSAANA